MKKQLLAFLLLAGASATSFAQPVLTATGLNPVLGNSFTTINCDTSGLLLANVLTARGANHTWNYSTLTTISTDTATEVTCASTTHCTLFSAITNMASKTLSSSAYVYNYISADSLTTTGYYASASQNAIFTNPMVTLKYPCHYLDSFVDAYAGSITYDPGTGAITAHETGNITVVADGWGTLVTPLGTDTAVLRLRGTQTFIDSATIFSIPAVITVQLTTFQWYQLNYHAPLMTISFTDQISGPGSLHTKTVSYAKKYPLGISDIAILANSLSLYPNPASDELNIKFEANDKARVSLVDMVGREVSVIAYTGSAGIQEISYNTSSIAKGIYLVRVQSGAETITKKVVLQ